MADSWKYIVAVVTVLTVIYLRLIFEYGHEDEDNESNGFSRYEGEDEDTEDRPKKHLRTAKSKQNILTRKGNYGGKHHESKQDFTTNEGVEYDPEVNCHDPDEEGCMTVGMDIGNSYSRVGYIKNGQTWYSPKIPSCVGFEADGSMVVGSMVSPPGQTFCGFKRLIGFPYEWIKQRTANLLFTVFPKRGQNLDVEINGNKRRDPKRLSMELLLAALMGKLKHMAEEELGDAVTSAILVIHSKVSERHLQYTRRAAEVIGLHREKFVSEPMAAVMSNEYNKGNFDKSRRKYSSYTVVIGVGGSHYDVGVTEVVKYNYPTLSQIRLEGGQIGSDDITFTIVEMIKINFESSGQKTALMDSEVNRRIYREAERIKRVLTKNSDIEYIIELPRRVRGKVDSVKGSMTRNELRQICAPMVKQIIATLRPTMTASRIKTKDVEKVILTGGGIGLPGLKGALMNFFPDHSFLMGGDWGLYGAMLLAARPSLPRNLLIPTSLTESIGIGMAMGPMKIMAKKGSLLPYESTTSFKVNDIGGPFSEIKFYSGDNVFASRNTLLGTIQLSGMHYGMDSIKIHLNIATDRCIKIKVQNANTDPSGRRKCIETQYLVDRNWLLSKQRKHFESEKRREECDRFLQQVYTIKSRKGQYGTDLTEAQINELWVLADEVTFMMEKESPSRIKCHHLLGNFERMRATILDKSKEDA